MNFLQPWMLWALPAIGIPIAIHLIHKRRQKVVEWGAMMFLLQGAKMSRGMQRLRHFLLLTLRTLAVAGLVIGLGRPIAGGWLGGMGGGRPDTVLILLDRSASMREQISPGGPSKLESGVARIAEALANVAASRFACIDSVTLDVTEMASPTDLVGLPRAGTTDAHSDIPGMLEVAAEHLRVNAAGRAEIWICTDGQSGDWRPEDGRWPALQEALLAMSAGARVNVLSYSDRDPQNLGVRVSRAQRLSSENQTELSLDFVVRANVPSEERQQVPVAINLGGARSVVQVDLVAGEANLAGHRVAIEEESGASWGYVELPPDAQSADNRFYFTYGETTVQETVIVAEDPDVSDVLRMAAEAPLSDNLEYAARVIPAADATQLNLEGAALLLWQAALPEDEVAVTVEQFIDAGGQVIFLPPAETSDAAFLGYQWGPRAEAGEDGTPAAPGSWRTEDDLLRDGEDGTRLPLKQLEISSLTPVLGDLTPMASLTDGRALLSRAPTSRGGLYFLGTTTAVEDSNLATQGIVLVATVHRALDAAAEAIGARGQQEAGGYAPLVQEYERVSDTEETWLLSEHLEHSGSVKVGEAFVALNRRAAEDQSAPLADQRLTQLMPEVDVSLVAGGVESKGLVEEIWRVFLMVILFALIAEALLCMTESSPPKEPQA